jgi:branched-chain amino acid transport system permease protein
MLIDFLEKRKIFLAFLVFFAFLIAVPPFLSKFAVELLTQILIWAVVAVSLNLLLGYTGLPTLGHASYMGLSAYTTAILTTRYQGTFLEVVALCILLSLVTAAVFGALALRAKGHYFLLITMALALVIWGLAYRWVSFTGGDNGISGLKRPDLGLPWSLNNTLAFYYFVFFYFAIAFVLMFMLIRSPFGTTLLGIRESESRMRSLGYNVWLHKYLAFIIAGIFSGLAGVYWAFYNKFVSPIDVDTVFSLEALLMVASGGPGTFFGPVIGASLFVLLKYLVSIYTKRWMMFMGVIFVLTVFYTPDGIVSLLRRGWDGILKARQGIGLKKHA